VVYVYKPTQFCAVTVIMLSIGFIRATLLCIYNILNASRKTFCNYNNSVCINAISVTTTSSLYNLPTLFGILAFSAFARTHTHTFARAIYIYIYRTASHTRPSNSIPIKIISPGTPTSGFFFFSRLRSPRPISYGIRAYHYSSLRQHFTR